MSHTELFMLVWGGGKIVADVFSYVSLRWLGSLLDIIDKLCLTRERFGFLCLLGLAPRTNGSCVLSLCHVSAFSSFLSLSA